MVYAGRPDCYIAGHLFAFGVLFMSVPAAHLSVLLDETIDAVLGGRTSGVCA